MFFAFVKRIRISSPGITFFTYTIEGVSTRVHHWDRYLLYAKSFAKYFVRTLFQVKLSTAFNFEPDLETNRNFGNTTFVRNILQTLQIENVG